MMNNISELNRAKAQAKAAALAEVNGQLAKDGARFWKRNAVHSVVWAGAVKLVSTACNEDVLTPASCSAALISRKVGAARIAHAIAERATDLVFAVPVLRVFPEKAVDLAVVAARHLHAGVPLSDQMTLITRWPGEACPASACGDVRGYTLAAAYAPLGYAVAGGMAAWQLAPVVGLLWSQNFHGSVAQLQPIVGSFAGYLLGPLRAPTRWFVKRCVDVTKRRHEATTRAQDGVQKSYDDYAAVAAQAAAVAKTRHAAAASAPDDDEEGSDVFEDALETLV